MDISEIQEIYRYWFEGYSHAKIGMGDIDRILDQLRTSRPPGSPPAKKGKSIEVPQSVQDHDVHFVLQRPPFNKIRVENDKILESAPEDKFKIGINGELIPIGDYDSKNKEWFTWTVHEELLACSRLTELAFISHPNHLLIPNVTTTDIDKHTLFRCIQCCIFTESDFNPELFGINKINFNAIVKSDAQEFLRKRFAEVKSYFKKLHVNDGDIINELRAKQYFYQYLLAPSNKSTVPSLQYVTMMFEFDEFPKDIWSNPDLTFADIQCKTGINMAEIIIRRMKGLKNYEPDEQKRLKHIYDTTYCCDDNDTNLYLTKFILGGGKIEKKSIMECNTKSDFVFITPNFSRKRDNSILNKTLKLAKQYYCALTPALWCQPDSKFFSANKGNIIFINRLDEEDCLSLFGTRTRADGVLIKI